MPLKLLPNRRKYAQIIPVNLTINSRRKSGFLTGQIIPVLLRSCRISGMLLVEVCYLSDARSLSSLFISEAADDICSLTCFIRNIFIKYYLVFFLKRLTDFIIIFIRKPH